MVGPPPGRRRGSLVVVPHDRWFLDAVCTTTWEVRDGAVHQYEGGYAAYVLARAERDRQAAAREDRRQQLMRKELAWLRRGPPARTSKPKFRIEAANALIADEPEPGTAPSSCASPPPGSATGCSTPWTSRWPTASGGAAPRDLAAGPGRPGGAGRRQRVGQDVADEGPGRRGGADGGVVERGATVRLAHLSQDTAEIPGHLRVLESLEEVQGRAKLADGQEITAGMLADRFGFRGDRARTLVRDLSGGERRRLQLMRLLMDEPNVLLLDEPTNDLDIDTLTALEDLLDAWPGTLVVVSHDRYFVERVCDNVYALMGDGAIRHLPGGIEQYLELRHAAEAAARRGLDSAAAPRPPLPALRRRPARGAQGGRPAGARAGEAHAREAELHAQMAAAATDFGRLRELDAELRRWPPSGTSSRPPGWRPRRRWKAVSDRACAQARALPVAGCRQRAGLGDAGAHLGVADLDRQHRVLQLSQLGVGALDRLDRVVDVPAGSTAWPAAPIANERGGKRWRSANSP